MSGSQVRQKTQVKGVLMLLLTAIVWGSSFVAQSIGMEKIQAFTFTAIRTLLGAIVLLPIICIRGSIQKTEIFSKKTLTYGVILGVIFSFAQNFQQFAFYYSTAGKIAFITAFYMFFVPVFGLFLKKRIPWITWLCVIAGLVGLYFLCINSSDLSAINKGDILALICAVFYAVHILVIERFAPEVDGIQLSCVQFAVGGVISLILMFIFETPQMPNIIAAGPSLAYSGIMSCGLAYTFQIIGQKYTEATVASLLMCMESVFAVLTAAIVLHEMLSGREIVGCVIMFTAIVISQIPWKTRFTKN